MSMTAGILAWVILHISFILHVSQTKDVHVQESHECIVVDTILDRHRNRSHSGEQLGFDRVSTSSAIYWS